MRFWFGLFFFHFEGLTVPFHTAVEHVEHSSEDFLPMKSILPWKKFCLISDFQNVDEPIFILVDKISCFQPAMVNSL